MIIVFFGMEAQQNIKQIKKRQLSPFFLSNVFSNPVKTRKNLQNDEKWSKLWSVTFKPRMAGFSNKN